MKNNIDLEKINLAKNISKALSENKSPQEVGADIPSDKMSKILNILSDDDKLKKIIESDDAQALLKKFGKE